MIGRTVWAIGMSCAAPAAHTCPSTFEGLDGFAGTGKVSAVNDGMRRIREHWGQCDCKLTAS